MYRGSKQKPGTGINILNTPSPTRYILFKLEQGESTEQRMLTVDMLTTDKWTNNRRKKVAIEMLKNGKAPGVDNITP